MKSILEYVNEDEQQIDESFGGFALIATEIALLSWAVGVFIKSFKDLTGGEGGIIDIVKELLKDNKIERLCKKLAKDDDVKAFLASKENVKKDAFTELIKTKLPEKDANYLLELTQDKVASFAK